MNRLLDIIIIDEIADERCISGLLDSFAKQKYIDFSKIGILIVNNNSNKYLKNSMFRKYPQLYIEYHKNVSNVSPTDYAISISSAQYISIFDSNGTLCGDNNLSQIMDFLVNNEPMIVSTNVSYGNCLDNNCQIANNLFGIIIKKQIIDDYELKIDNNIVIFNDFYLRNILSICSFVIKIDVCFYKSRYNNDFSSLVLNNFCELINCFGKINDFMLYTKNIIKKVFIRNYYYLEYINVAFLNGKFKSKVELFLSKYVEYMYSTKRQLLKIKDYIENFISSSGFNLVKLDYINQELFKQDKSKDYVVLDLIVPYFNEKYELLKKFLDSVSRQKCVDFDEVRILLVSDKVDNIFDIDVINNDYPNLNIVQYNKNSNMGPGQARQFGLERSFAKYVSFYDADDLMYEPDGLCRVLYYLKAFEYELLYSKYYVVQNGKISLSDCRQLLCLHGSFFNREILLKYNFCFHKSIIYFEDMHFCSVTNICMNTKMLEYPTYVWLRRDNSASKLESNDMNYVFRNNLDDFIVANQSIISDCINKTNLMKIKFDNLGIDPEKGIASFILGRLFYMFILVESDVFYGKNVDNYELTIYSQYLKIKKYYDLLTKYEINEIFEEKVKTVIKDNGATEIKMSFDDFLEFMKEK